MNYSIDVFFVGKNQKVISILRNCKPWRIYPYYWKAQFVVECPSGFLTDEFRVGDEIGVICIS
jgi:uncharacterized membrane protein (UPF0127 family)